MSAQPQRRVKMHNFVLYGEWGWFRYLFTLGQASAFSDCSQLDMFIVGCFYSLPFHHLFFCFSCFLCL